MLLLVEGEEKECLPKFGVPIFILAHKLNKFYSLSWKHCTYTSIDSAFLVLSQWYMHLFARHLVKYVGMACPYTERTDRILVSQSNWTRQASHLFASH